MFVVVVGVCGRVGECGRDGTNFFICLYFSMAYRYGSMRGLLRVRPVVVSAEQESLPVSVPARGFNVKKVDLYTFQNIP